MNHSMHAGHGKADHLHADPSTGVAALKDPVCGMTVTAQSPHHAEHMGRRFFFCGPKCKTKFDADPMLYMGQSTDKAAEQPVVAGTVYTCPMHLEIRQDHPGNCPKCGMTLEHVMPSLVDVAADRYCFRTGHVWTPTAVDGHGVTELGGVHTGYPHRGVGRVAVYFEAAAVTISLPLLGQMLELKARSQTSAAIKSLLDLAPKLLGASKQMVREFEEASVSIETGDVQSKNAKRIPFFYIHLLMPRIVNGLTVLSQSTLNFFHYENSLEEAFMKVAK